VLVWGGVAGWWAQIPLRPNRSSAVLHLRRQLRLVPVT